jgi:hypothetical protein
MEGFQELQYVRCHRNLYQKLKTQSYAGFEEQAFNFVAYCIPSLIRLFSREGSFASTYKLSTGDVLNAPSESRNP